MREIPDEMAARIESGTATLCHVWIVERADGVSLGFTDHDRRLEVDGVPCSASSGWSAGASDDSVGLRPGAATASGGLDSEGLTEADIEAGGYDEAKVSLWRVDWEQPELKVRLWVSRIARLVRDGEAFTAELEGPLSALERVVGRAYGRSCDAVLGDARCRVDVSERPGARCDKRWETCLSVFANGANFQGFPDIPGDDFLLATPVEGGRHDGGSRR